MSLDLPLIWAGIIAVAVLMYVLLDGFDLGVGILFPFAGSPQERDVMMDSVAPIWDGNETWLVLGGGGLLAAFPFAYAALMPALYIPILLMLMALILRGVAFEFRLRGRRRGKRFWTAAFTTGSIAATVAQGFVLGGFIQGITLADGRFAGGRFDWLTPYTVLVAAGLLAGYALLGAAWLIWKTEDELHGRARRWAWLAAGATAVLLAAVSAATLLVHPRVAERWGFQAGSFDVERLLPLLPIPAIGLAGLAVVVLGLRAKSHGWPFFGAFLLFLSGYLGLAVGFFPNIVPYDMSFRQAASADNALAFMLVGVVILLPAILGYTAWVYWVFRGKVSADAGYH
jgi:cytochrome d ubiquinol oxidase subunit II